MEGDFSESSMNHFESFKQGEEPYDKTFDEIKELWDQTYGSKTKSGVRFPAIDEFYTMPLCETKSTQNLGETLVYVFNFENNGGFAIARDVGDYTQIIALSDRGNVDSSKLLNTDALFSETEEEFYYSFLNECILCPIVTDTNAFSESPDFDYIGFTGVGPYDPSLPEIGVWNVDESVGPIVLQKWGQCYPFNMYLPLTPDTLSAFGPSSAYRGHYAAGCSMVAAGQMIVANSRPLNFWCNGHRYYTPTFRDVSNFVNYSDYLYYNYDSHVTDTASVFSMEGVAALLNYLGVIANASYKPSGSTGAWPDTMFVRLSAWDSFYSGFEKHEFRVHALNGKIDTTLRSNKPVMIYGYSGDGSNYSGHTWLIDGFLYRHKNFSGAFSITEHLFHFNFGWSGKSDGYYASGRMAIDDRLFRDGTIDTNPYVSGTNYNFSTNAYYYTY